MGRLGAAELADLLERTSRTFALAIPLLEEPLATQVGAAYLLFRIADTFEDASLWNRDRRLEALRSFTAWLEGAPLPDYTEPPPLADAGCLDLLRRADDVRAVIEDPRARAIIESHVKRTAIGMIEFVARQGEDGSLELRDVDDLRAYCYVVAGIVGEMLTELFILAAPSLKGATADLVLRAPRFGQGLQLVNILKDAPSDAREGRVYLPANTPRAEIVRIARDNLESAAEYVSYLEGTSIHAFCELPVKLAVLTLDRLDEGAPKLTREEVMRAHREVTSR